MGFHFEEDDPPLVPTAPMHPRPSNDAHDTDPEALVETEPPGPLPRPPRPYRGEPEPDLLSRIYDALCAPGGELSKIRGDVNGLINVVRHRQEEDKANWDFVKREVSRACVGVDRVEAKLDKIDQRVGELELRASAIERRAAAQDARLDAIEARLAESTATPP